MAGVLLVAGNASATTTSARTLAVRRRKEDSEGRGMKWRRELKVGGEEKKRKRR
jgi:hypothetical protein